MKALCCISMALSPFEIGVPIMKNAIIAAAAATALRNHDILMVIALSSGTFAVSSS